MAINNARAVLEAMFNHASEFTRTPKYGIVKKEQTFKNTKYTTLKSLIPILELGFAAYFTVFVLLAMEQRQWGSIPFLMLFQGGFAYVGLASIAQWRPRVEEPEAEEETEEALCA
jgi:hypothetical protein